MLLTIARAVQVERLIAKSRFICRLQRVGSEAEAQAFIKEVKKEHWDASHNCSAYIIDQAAQRSSDDGEPAGTAGAPMLGVLRHQQLQQVAAVVTRYFGGIKLGTGGLVRAYSGCVQEAVAAAGLVQLVMAGCYGFSCPAAAAGRLLSQLYSQAAYPVAGVEHGEPTLIQLLLEPGQVEEAEQYLTARLGRPLRLQLLGRQWLEREVGPSL